MELKYQKFSTCDFDILILISNESLIEVNLEVELMYLYAWRQK